MFEKKDIKVYILLLSAPVLLTIYRYHGYPEFFYKVFGNGYTDVDARLWQFAVFFVLMFIIPFLTIKFGFKEKLSDYGFGLGNVKEGLKWLLTIPLIVVPAIYLSSKMPDIRVEYPMAKSLLTDTSQLLKYELAYVVFYYIAWEFFFRGFLLFGLKDRFGEMNAILIQTISSCLVHIGKPEGEIIGSIVVGIIFGIIALRTRSIWYVFAIHASIGVLTDLFIIYYP